MRVKDQSNHPWLLVKLLLSNYKKFSAFKLGLKKVSLSPLFLKHVTRNNNNFLERLISLQRVNLTTSSNQYPILEHAKMGLYKVVTGEHEEVRLSLICENLWEWLDRYT